MWEKVLETYRCILSCRKNLPGMKLEDALKSDAVADMEREQEWLKQKAREEGVEIFEG